MSKIDTLFLSMPFEAGHTYSLYKGATWEILGTRLIREYPSPLGQTHREVSQINTFRSVSMCRKLELICNSSFSTIGSVLYRYLDSTKNPRLWQLSESVPGTKLRISTNPLHPGLLMHKISKPQPFLDWISFRKRNTISLWEIASRCYRYYYTSDERLKQNGLFTALL